MPLMLGLREGGMMSRLCDEDYSHCPIIRHPNNRLLTKVLNELLDRFGDDVYKIVQGNCPNLTVCYDCRIDDFCHISCQHYEGGLECRNL